MPSPECEPAEVSMPMSEARRLKRRPLASRSIPPLNPQNSFQMLLNSFPNQLRKEPSSFLPFLFPSGSSFDWKTLYVKVCAASPEISAAVLSAKVGTVFNSHYDPPPENPVPGCRTDRAGLRSYFLPRSLADLECPGCNSSGAAEIHFHMPQFSLVIPKPFCRRCL